MLHEEVADVAPCMCVCSCVCVFTSCGRDVVGGGGYASESCFVEF